MKCKRKHHDLLVWQEAIALVQDIYTLTSRFPSEEMYALTSQMRRAAISIPSNIAEGAARTSKKEFMQFLSISRGSLSELETQVLLAHKIGYLPDNKAISEKIETIFSLLGGLMKSIKGKMSK